MLVVSFSFTSNYYALANDNSLDKALFLFLIICSSDNEFVNESFIKT